MRRAVRTVAIYFLLTLLFFAGACAAVISVSRAQDDKGKQEPPPLPGRDLEPRGPDELFTPLPDTGLFEGKAPARAERVVILRVPNQESWNDSPELDLSAADRFITGGFDLSLEQQIEYRPWFFGHNDRARVTRYQAMLRNAEVPRAGQGELTGKKFKGAEAALATLDAEIAFLLSYLPAGDESPARGAAFRYRRGVGVEATVAWDFPKLGKPEPDSAVRMIEAKVVELMGKAPGDHPFAPVPPLCASDAALREFVKMRDTFSRGELTSALIHYSSLMQKDPACGRAALYGTEIYRGLAESLTAEEHEKYVNRAVQLAREAVALAPNDVLLRGYLVWNAAVHFNRFDFAQATIRQARRVQPASVELVQWWLTAWSTEDKAKQAEWLIKEVLPVVKDGRIELEIGHVYYGSGNYAGGFEWYGKGIKVNPDDHELQMSIGLCGTYHAESSFKKRDEATALEAWATATESLARAQDLDPQEIKWVYEYYPRVATHDYTWLPSNEAELERLFLTQAVLTGLESNSRSWQFDRLAKDILPSMKRTLRETCKAAKPDDPLYVMKLLARAQFAIVDQDNDELVHTLWLMRGYGIRAELYTNLMSRLGPLVEDYKPKEK